MNFRKTLLAVTFILFSTSFAFSQQLGHLSTSEIVEFLPGKKAADEKIMAKQKEYEAEIKKMTAELQSAFEKAQKDFQENKLSQEQQIELEKSLQSKQTRIGEYQQTASKSIKKLNDSLYEPLLNKLNEAINAVAKKKNLKYVLDSSANGVVLVAEGTDITEAVKKELGL